MKRKPHTEASNPRNQVVIEFTRPEDVRLLTMLKQMAYDRRYPLPTFLILSLHEAFQHLLPEVETSVPDPPSLPVPQTNMQPETGKPVQSRRKPPAASVKTRMQPPAVERSAPNPPVQIPPLRQMSGKELAALTAGRPEPHPTA
jgi:hypothetical protein